MKKAKLCVLTLGVSILSLIFCLPATSAMRNNSSDKESTVQSRSTEKMMESEGDVDIEAQDDPDMEEVKAPVPISKKKKKKILSGEESFIAGPEWEFDGFVAGGQDQEVKSMFIVNDLIYLNVGVSQGLAPGDRLGIYKRGERIRDPQSGQFLGYEVRRVGTVEVTNRIEDETCSTRVINSNTGIEIGDLARRDR